MGLAYVVAGAMHFVKPDGYVRIMPDWLPAHLLLVYLSGVAEIVLGAGLWFTATRRWAAWGLIAMLMAIFPANLNMAINYEQFANVPAVLLYLRLPLQLLFIYWAWIYTKKDV